MCCNEELKHRFDKDTSGEPEAIIVNCKNLGEEAQALIKEYANRCGGLFVLDRALEHVKAIYKKVSAYEQEQLTKTIKGLSK